MSFLDTVQLMPDERIAAEQGQRSRRAARLIDSLRCLLVEVISGNESGVFGTELMIQLQAEYVVIVLGETLLSAEPRNCSPGEIPAAEELVGNG